MSVLNCGSFENLLELIEPVCKTASNDISVTEKFEALLHEQIERLKLTTHFGGGIQTEKRKALCAQSDDGRRNFTRLTLNRVIELSAIILTTSCFLEQFRCVLMKEDHPDQSNVPMCTDFFETMQHIRDRFMQLENRLHKFGGERVSVSLEQKQNDFNAHDTKIQHLLEELSRHVRQKDTLAELKKSIDHICSTANELGVLQGELLLVDDLHYVINNVVAITRDLNNTQNTESYSECTAPGALNSPDKKQPVGRVSPSAGNDATKFEKKHCFCEISKTTKNETEDIPVTGASADASYTQNADCHCLDSESRKCTKDYFGNDVKRLKTAAETSFFHAGTVGENIFPSFQHVVTTPCLSVTSSDDEMIPGENYNRVLCPPRSRDMLLSMSQGVTHCNADSSESECSTSFRSTSSFDRLEENQFTSERGRLYEWRANFLTGEKFTWEDKNTYIKHRAYESDQDEFASDYDGELYTGNVDRCYSQPEVSVSSATKMNHDINDKSTGDVTEANQPVSLREPEGNVCTEEELLQDLKTKVSRGFSAVKVCQNIDGVFKETPLTDSAVGRTSHIDRRCTDVSNRKVEIPPKLDSVVSGLHQTKSLSDIALSYKSTLQKIVSTFWYKSVNPIQSKNNDEERCKHEKKKQKSPNKNSMQVGLSIARERTNGEQHFHSNLKRVPNVPDERHWVTISLVCMPLIRICRMVSVVAIPYSVAVLEYSMKMFNPFVTE